MALGGASLAAWVYLAFFHGRFWRADQRLADGAPVDSALSAAAASRSLAPSVVAVVPARDEAEVIERSIASLLDQDYPGPFSVVLVDDHSDDDTAVRARAIAASHARGDRLEVVRAADRPPGWVGKMWAVHSGVAHALDGESLPDFVLLTDADVAHEAGNVRRLVAKADGADTAGRPGGEPLQLVSLMVLLHCRSGWEQLLIPAFVYFFQKLYPFPLINDPGSRMAGAAGGCMLVRTEALVRAGGIAAIRDRVIDDCALAAAIKSRSGPIWVGVTESEVSFRPYRGLYDIWHMVARSAYTQLHHSPLLLAGTVVGLLLIYVAPPALALAWPFYAGGESAFAELVGTAGAPGIAATAALCGLAAWTIMACTFVPTLRMYGLAPVRAFLLPIAGILYLCMTIGSARLHWIGRGATWKGRAGAGA